MHYFFFLLVISNLFFVGCEVSFSPYQKIKVILPKLSQEYEIVSSWNIYGIQDTKVRLFSSGEKRSGSINLLLDKTGTIPVVACAVLAPLKEEDKECFLSAGAIYPFEEDLDTLQLRFFHRAEIARTIITMYERGYDIQKLNVEKLSRTIQKKSPQDLFDHNRFFSYLESRSISFWSIVPQKKTSIDIPFLDCTWYSASKWNPHLESRRSIELYVGRWLFFSVNAQGDWDLAWILIDEKGEVFSQDFKL